MTIDADGVVACPTICTEIRGSSNFGITNLHPNIIVTIATTSVGIIFTSYPCVMSANVENVISIAAFRIDFRVSMILGREIRIDS